VVKSLNKELNNKGPKRGYIRITLNGNLKNVKKRVLNLHIHTQIPRTNKKSVQIKIYTIKFKISKFFLTVSANRKGESKNFNQSTSACVLVFLCHFSLAKLTCM